MTALAVDALTLRDALRMMPAHERRALVADLIEEDLKAADPPLWIYIIEAGDAFGDLKVGISRDPNRRLGELQRSNPQTLHLRVQFRAALAEERAFHEQYARLRIQGEWFRYSPEILEDARRYARRRRHLG